MKLHHAAALALAVWYLMVPPRRFFGIPIANWERRAVYDTKAQCESVFTPRAGRPFGKGPLPPGDPFADYPYWNYPQCVSSDDPRLAK